MINPKTPCHRGRYAGHAAIRRFPAFAFLLLALCLMPFGKTAFAEDDLRFYLRDPDGAPLSAARWRAESVSATWYMNSQSLTIPRLVDIEIQFRPPPEYYTPTNWIVNIVDDTTLTNFFYPWTNEFNVTMQDENSNHLATAEWELTEHPASFTNFTSGVGSLSPVLCPTGKYVIAFSDVTGYETPDPASWTNDITGAEPAAFTSIYERTVGDINISVIPTNGSWTVTPPADFGDYSDSELIETNEYTLTNAPSGLYTITFDELPGYETPSPVVTNINAFPVDIHRDYGEGRRLTIHVIQPGEDVRHERGDFISWLDGIGVGTGNVTGAETVHFEDNVWLITPGADVTLSAFPETLTAFGMDFDSFFFEWDVVESGADRHDGEFHEVNPLTLTIEEHTDVYLLFSRAYDPWDNAGDLSQDGLPDEWKRREWANGPLDPKIAETYMMYPGQEDYIPSISSIPPTLLSRTAQNATTYRGPDGSWPGYPLRGSALRQGYNRETHPFSYYWQCRGLDEVYGTNGGHVDATAPGGFVAYEVPNDDPMVDPTLRDTNENGLPDGWSYYFWYWRSANAYQSGITNSANLDWVEIAPSTRRIRYAGGTGSPSGPDADTDGDGLYDGEEYLLGTDPTHADTDGDGMDDYWEVRLGDTIFPGTDNPLNPLDQDGTINPVDKFYAVSTRTRVLTEGTTGTAFSDTVYHDGTTNVVWVDVCTETGPGVFDLYRDILLSGSASNGMVGVAFTNDVGETNNVLYAGAGGFVPGYPVWVDEDDSGDYSSGDIDIVNPFVKHDGVYSEPPENPGPGVTSFNPLLGWDSGDFETYVNVRGLEVSYADVLRGNQAYNAYQNYLGGDFLGRLSWCPGGQVIAEHDDDDSLTRNSYTHPGLVDTDGDGIPDGWELYVGMNPNSAADADRDPDNDKLTNLQEWANASDPLSNCAEEWPNKIWPTDPGVIVAPPPNDPHPHDTSWDGVSDGDSREHNLNPTSWDTDGDFLPDGWELYAGTDPLVRDAREDPDRDGLLNYQEYWTGTVPEWMMCDPAWNLNFITRRAMSWDPMIDEDEEEWTRFFMPPNFLTCPSFRYENALAGAESLRDSHPAGEACDYKEYRTTKADDPDSDGDGMDDFWEVYHGLNPVRGKRCLMLPTFSGGFAWRSTILLPPVASADARPGLDGFQFGLQETRWTHPGQLLDYIDANGLPAVLNIVGPFNFGLELMDPDGDGLPNREEYSYSRSRPFYHTDPTPLWRTCEYSPASFVNMNYTFDRWTISDWAFYEMGWSPEEWLRYPFPFGMNEGFDTDGDLVGDYHEVNRIGGVGGGTDPLDPRNPIRNRVLKLDGNNDFARMLSQWTTMTESFMTKFCVEAWIKPSSATVSKDTVVIVEKAGMFPNPYDLSQELLRANFRLGLANGLPFIMYNGRGAGTAYQATARISHRVEANSWTHIAGTYDGTYLRIYVNGEVSATLRTTEVPATGYIWAEYGIPNSIIVGAAELNPGIRGTEEMDTADHFGGYVDQVRVWNESRTRGQVHEYMDKRIFTHELTNSAYLNLFAYWSFDDLPDPGIEGIVPEGMADLDTQLRFHPTLSWWSDHPQRSTVYTGSAARPYNYIVSAQNHIARKPIVPPMDDYYNTRVEEIDPQTGETNLVARLPEGYRNPSNPYHTQFAHNNGNFVKDLYLYRGAKGVRPSTTWLPVVDPNDADSVDSSGDGMPDWWKVLHGLDPHSSEGDDGPWGDPDGDGLHNLAEYLAGTDPWQWDTSGDGLSDYYSSAGPGTLTWGELYSAGDWIDPLWKAEHGLDPLKYAAHLDPDGDGWSNYAEFQAGTDPSDPNDYPRPRVSGTISYSGVHSGTLRVLAYQNERMEGTPVATYSGSMPDFSLTGFGEGDVYLFGFIDLNGNGRWDPGEPCGVAHDQPVRLSWSDVGGVVLGISDESPGYGRFSWTVPAGTNAVDVRIKRISQPGAPLVLSRTVRAPRNWFHEWDYQLAGKHGLEAGSYQWWAGTQSGTFIVNWASAQAQPYIIYPRGETFTFDGNRLGWLMDSEATEYRLQILNGALDVVIDEYYTVPYPDKDGIYWVSMPRYYDANDLGNGIYFWRVAGSNPRGASEWSDWQSFRVGLSSETSRSISGSIFYYGKAPTTRIVVQAFDNPAFSGKPKAVKTYRNPSRPSGQKHLRLNYTLRGLRAGTYYVRAFIDTKPAGGDASGTEEFWSTSGFVTVDGDLYRPGALNVERRGSISSAHLVLRDKDTDSDIMPDAWEMAYFGNLHQTGDMDFDGDGESNLYEYMVLDTNPAWWDTARNGLSDGFARLYGGNPMTYDPYCPTTNPRGRDLHALRWSTDGSGYSDGAQLRRYRTDPLDPKSVPEYLPECFGSRPAPADFDGDGRSDLVVYDEHSGVWHILTWYGEYYAAGWGDHVSRPMYGDFAGDGISDFAVYNQLTGDWYVYTSTGELVILPFGNSNMIPVPGDYNGDWRTDFGVYDTTTGIWYIFTWNGQFTALQFGSPFMIPVPGDYIADGRTDFAVYEPATGLWYIFTWDMQFFVLQFGYETCIPVPGDYDGDDKNDFAVFDTATGTWYIFTWRGEFRQVQWGWPGAVPVPADYSGDGRTDLAVYCRDTGQWFIYCWSGGGTFYYSEFGGQNYSPVLRSW